MRWIALHLPQLSLESFVATLPEEARAEPAVLMDLRRVLDANAPARALGVQPGLQRATALALAPQIRLGQADPTRDGQALAAVAHVALAFTPTVTIERVDAPHTVLLEVQASLRYFGGLASLLQRLQRALAPLGHRVHVVSAATPLGAALLARRHPRLDCADLAGTRGALAAVPLSMFGPAEPHAQDLQGMGLRTLADLRTVPRAGVSRRFGPALLEAVDRAMGIRPDPRVPLIPAPVFDSRLELWARVDSAEPLMHAAGMLLEQLVAWLSARHALVRRFTLVMRHEQGSRRATPTAETTALEVTLAEPSRDSAHWQGLLRERLVRQPLPAPTLELRLQAHDLVHRAPPHGELFATPQAEQEGLTRLIERLQARLGAEQVRRLEPLQDHRPERASAWRAVQAPIRTTRTRPGPSDEAPGCGVRPVWLWTRPEPLRERDSLPVLDGQPLQLLSGPERIEAGWWDGALAQRDYFIAQLDSGALVWIYRARLPTPELPQGWFLQGRFG